MTVSPFDSCGEAPVSRNAAGEADFPAPSVKVADTVGAGDSFMAALLSGLVDRGLDGAQNRKDLREIPAGSVVHFEREIVGEGMWSAARERLTEAGPETTLWESENEYRFSGVLMRLVGMLMPGAFRKQSLQHMQDFKAYAEHGHDVREAKS